MPGGCFELKAFAIQFVLPSEPPQPTLFSLFMVIILQWLLRSSFLERVQIGLFLFIELKFLTRLSVNELWYPC